MAKKQTPEGLYKKKLDFINSSLSDFDKDLRKLQVGLFDSLLTNYISQLVIIDGAVVMNRKNRALLLQLDKYLDDFKRTASLKTFAKLGDNMIKMTGLTSDYFNALVGGKKTIANLSKKVEAYRQLVGISAEGKVISGSFIDHLAEGGNLRTALSNYMQRSVGGQTDYKTFVKGFKDLVKGSKETNGAYERYVGGYAHDTFFAQGRQQDNFFAEQLGLNYFIYVGTEIKTTRPFCRSRHSKTFSREQGEAWDTMDWQGKIEDVPFFDQAGGYNCRHTIRWITDEEAEERGVTEMNEE